MLSPRGLGERDGSLNDARRGDDRESVAYFLGGVAVWF